MKRNRDCEAHKRGGNQNFRSDVSGGNNCIAPNAQSINNYYNYAGSVAAVVEQKFEKHYRSVLAKVQRVLDKYPQIDIIHLKYLLHETMPRKYDKQIEQLHRKSQQGATLNISIDCPSNNKSRTRTVTLNDHLQPPQTAAGE